MASKYYYKKNLDISKYFTYNDNSLNFNNAVCKNPSAISSGGNAVKNKTNIPGNVVMLVLKLLEEGDMYGWQIIEELARRSYDIFQLKTGALYPILHGMENDGFISCYKETVLNGRVRKYYRIANSGKQELAKKRLDWESYAKAVSHILEGGGSYEIGYENC